jgi:hypothetical protein
MASSGKIPGARTASIKEVRELSKLSWVLDEALSSRGHEARVLPDGRVLLYWGEGQKGNLYPSREVLAQMQRETAEEMAKARSGPGPAQTLLPPIDDFLRDVEAHAKSLGPRLRIPDDVLDYTPESLDAVDKALKRIPWAKRQIPELVTPLVAYLGEVIRRATGGQWTKVPTTTKEQEVAVYDPVEAAAYDAAKKEIAASACAAGRKAEAEARARRASKADVTEAFNTAHGAVYMKVWELKLEPIRFETIQVTDTRNANVPIITASGGRLFDPFAAVFLPMVEPSRRIPLRSTDGVPYVNPQKKTG